MFAFPLSSTVLAFAIVTKLSTTSPIQTSISTCRYIPGDPLWPSSQDWNELNSTVGGRLVATIPLGSPCHDPTYDAAECSYLQNQWDYAPVHVQSPSSIMQPWFQNGTCDPFHPESLSCTLGNLVEYSINASSAADVAAGLQFAQAKNIRLAIKNTGHDFAGKSTARYGLGIWTHNLNSINTLLNYTSASYTGPALKMGSGTQAAAAYEAAHALGYRIMGGTCPTVGLAGGYTQGGGHSVLSSTYGLGADNVLEWEVVTANGTHVIASPSSEPDLYWALSGGGGGTYGVVLSMTTKMHQESQTGGALLEFNLTTGEAFWTAVDTLQTGVAPIVDTGAVILYEITNSSLAMYLTAPNQNPSQIRSSLSYITNHLGNHSIPYALSITTDPTYFDYFQRYYGPLPDGIWQVAHLIGSRLIPRSVVAANSAALTDIYRNVTANGDWEIVSIALNVSHAVAGNTPSANAINPAWRDALLHTLAYSAWDWTAPAGVMAAREDVLTNQIEPMLDALTPGSGTYLNEANFNQKNALQAFFGDNLDRLTQVKKVYDPADLFYATTAVGSPAWVVDGAGRLCRA